MDVLLNGMYYLGIFRPQIQNESDIFSNAASRMWKWKSILVMQNNNMWQQAEICDIEFKLHKSNQAIDAY